MAADGVPGTDRQRRHPAGVDARVRRLVGRAGSTSGDWIAALAGRARAPSRCRWRDSADPAWSADACRSPYLGSRSADGSSSVRTAGARWSSSSTCLPSCPTCRGIGTEWQLPGEFGRVEWFGDGPHECYSDRRGAAVVVGTRRRRGHVTSTTCCHRARPPHGCALGGAASFPRSGLVVVADPDVGDGTVGMSVRRHSDAELWACTHTDELARLEQQRPPNHLARSGCRQRGIGTSACGPDALAQVPPGGGPTRRVEPGGVRSIPAARIPESWRRRSADEPFGPVTRTLLDAGGDQRAPIELVTLMLARCGQRC